MGYKKVKSGYRIVARCRVNGKILHKQETVDCTLERAKKLVEQYKAELRDSGSLKAKNKISTFSDCLKVYVEKRNKISAPDISRCKKLDRDLGNVSLNDFSDRFEKYLNLIKHEKTKRGKPYAGASLNRLVEIVKACFTLCYDLEKISKNPIIAKDFPMYKEKARDRYLTIEERMRLFNAIAYTAPYLLPFVQYNLTVPCRKSELLTLPKENYNAITKTIYVPDSKSGDPLHKPVPKSMIYYFENIPPECPYLFYRKTSKGQYRPLGDFRKAWKSCLKRAGLINVRVHDLRHISATDLYTAGNSERKIMDIAGWKTPMLSTYRHKDVLKSAQSIVFNEEISSACDSVCDSVEAFG